MVVTLRKESLFSCTVICSKPVNQHMFPAVLGQSLAGKGECGAHSWGLQPAAPPPGPALLPVRLSPSLYGAQFSASHHLTLCVILGVTQANCCARLCCFHSACSQQTAGMCRHGRIRLQHSSSCPHDTALDPSV